MTGWLGIDIGGANIKLADLHGNTVSHPFPLWQRPDDLAAVLRQQLSAWPNSRRLAVTMTGELADCFSDKATGVRAIVHAVQSAVHACEPVTDYQLYATDGTFLTAEEVQANPLAVAASNWHATATLIARHYAESAILIDMGSTTTDLLAIGEGQVQTESHTDVDRLTRQELLYFGWLRTPTCAVIQQLPYRGGYCPVAAEVFSTIADAAVVAGLMPSQPEMASPADGRPLDKPHAAARLGRQICAATSPAEIDNEWNETDAEVAANAIVAKLAERMAQAVASVSRQAFPTKSHAAAPRLLVVGSGAELAKGLLLQSLPEAHFGELPTIGSLKLSSCAPAEAVAWLANEACQT